MTHELTLDTETYLIERARLAPPIVCYQSAVGDSDPDIALWCDAPIAEHLEGDYTYVTASGAFDFACIAAARPDLIPHILRAYDDGRVVDVQLDAKLLDIAAGDYTRYANGPGWSLEALARRIGIVLEKKDWRLRFQAFERVPVDMWPEGAREYALTDVSATRAVRRVQQAAAAVWRERGAEVLGVHSQQAARSAFGLHLASCWGVLTDRARTEHLARRIEAYLAGVRQRLISTGLVRADGTRNTKAAAQRMIDCCAAIGREVPRTPKGGVQLDKDACILAHDEDLYLYAEYSGANLIRGRCDRLAQGFELPLQTRFDPLKETTRTSSTQPGAPLIGEQMQNFPRSNALTEEEAEYDDRYGKDPDARLLLGLREAFTPRPGNIFVGADYSMAELHTVAQLCLKLFGFSKLAELLNAGVDVHWWLAAQTLGMTYEQIRAAEKSYKKDRQRVKPGNFGFWGGMGADKFILYSRKQFKVMFTQADAKRFKMQWQHAFPETRPYFDYISRQLGDRESFTYVHPITGFVRGGCGYSDGANHGFQHLAAFGAKDAIWEVTRACLTPGNALSGWRMWNFVHDEILLEGPLQGAQDAANMLQEIMARAFNRYVPDVPTHAEAFITPIWSKKAESKRTPTGELTVWQPNLPPMS